MVNKILFTALIVISTNTFAEEPSDNKWSNESELAIVKTTGNSVTENYSLKQLTSKKVNQNTYTINAAYLNTAAEDKTTGIKEETAFKWEAGLRYERAIDKKWSGLIAHLVESDKYAGFNQRHNTDLGGKYLIYKTEKQSLVGEVGFRYIHQNNNSTKQDNSRAARLFVEGDHKFNQSSSAKVSVEYIPNFDETEDYQTKAVASLSSTLSTLFSLKVSYEVATDNMPEAGSVKADTKFTTALVAKF